jgi:hypothetical protein
VILDSEAQRQLLLNLLATAPVQTTLGDVLAGTLEVQPDVAALVRAIRQAAVATTQGVLKE